MLIRYPNHRPFFVSFQLPFLRVYLILAQPFDLAIDSFAGLLVCLDRFAADSAAGFADSVGSVGSADFVDSAGSVGSVGSVGFAGSVDFVDSADFAVFVALSVDESLPTNYTEFPHRSG